jgi:hypothetical protein
VTRADKRSADGVKVTLTGATHGSDPTTTQDPEYASDEVEFMMAMDRFKLTRRRKFPTWAEALGVLKSLGYTKTVTEDTTGERSP